MQEAHPPKTGQLGTFAGVFTPSVLTILGIILFLRLGYVVGNAGLGRALIIIALANLISVLTSFSLAAIATNMKVKGGGDYYLISRTLGIEYGGAIGIVLFLAQSVSIAFYCIGFGEAVTGILGSPDPGHLPQVIAGAALVFLFVLAWVGADLATKFQYIVMGFLILALASFYLGGIMKWDTPTLVSNWSAQNSGAGFWILFALFFPAVTGFTQGVSMSGDLKDPGNSLPVGTFAAVILSIIVYFSVAIVFAAAAPLSALATDYGVMKQTAYVGFFIDAGVIAATLSSAMASFLGAPRILQSLSSDRIFPILAPFAKGVGKTNNPRRGVLLSFAIAILTIALGQLDLIAGVVSMFFLISYGLLNYATYFEAAAQSPSFRPRFKWYDKRLSLLGFLACMGVMLAIDFRTGLAAVAILFAIFQYLKRTAGPNRWSDSQRSSQLKTIRENLLDTQQDLEHPREWRPFILALSTQKERTAQLLAFADLLEGNSGMTTAVRGIQGRGVRALRLKEKMEKELALEIKETGHKAFPLVVASEDLSIGLPVLFQSFGIGPIHANTILVHYRETCDLNPDSMGLKDYTPFLKPALEQGCNIVLLDEKPMETPSPESGDDKLIDVWWQDDDTSRLMILLAYLITRNEKWHQAKIRLLAVHLDVDNRENIQTLNRMLEEIRIDAAPQIILRADAQAIVQTSSQADLVFLPIHLKKNTPVIFEDIPAQVLVPQLKTIALTMAASKVELDTAPEEGKSGDLAVLLDELRHAENRVQTAEQSALEAVRAAERLMETVNIQDSLADAQVLGRLKKALAARQKAADADKKVIKEKTKLLDISEQAKEEGLLLETEPSKEH